MNDPAIVRAEAVRHFNRFYTQHIGALHEHLQKSPFSLTEVRVMHELSRSQHQTAAALARNLGIDSGYLSRLLASFERRNLISRRPSEIDARQSLVSLTEAGLAAYRPLDAAAVDEVAAGLARLTLYSQDQLVAAMKLIERMLDERPRHSIVTLRAPRAGDFGLLVSRQAQLFAHGHGWDHTFEALLARQVAQFAQHHDARRENCWVAEQDGLIVGSALMAAASDDQADVSMLYVEPDVRRLGIGTQLIDECVRFAKRAGYRTVSVESESSLDDARRLFTRAGFVLASATPERRFGRDLVVERWEHAV
ncbi:MarR family transcriptional regulator/GNAT family N-acetyltransferase [Paraburkholderia sp. LEh10]|uniref:bifunctional helix-turn-helix transcriptional regulator/GNAT family N-acetyltransferase n=1 Tax=Paraburkholderia sp. LEh10 TaxID=2821353 RepID=UPI001AE478DB|nr:bifunctional helix-turn-helix transcriptional regulator/GNAT family N-acetyltransferase [Paraburkholderia sp. LEh10]MBP0588865.1 MarR family transcriptional regulator/GNAT family N-acetyltransferase [Paraburkholderia sp. LEh10]